MTDGIGPNNIHGTNHINLNKLLMLLQKYTNDKIKVIDTLQSQGGNLLSSSIRDHVLSTSHRKFLTYRNLTTRT